MRRISRSDWAMTPLPSYLTVHSVADNPRRGRVERSHVQLRLTLAAAGLAHRGPWATLCHYCVRRCWVILTHFSHRCSLFVSLFTGNECVDPPERIRNISVRQSLRGRTEL
ncbi:hypothetical protein AAFF_G00104440 [Aldrovandia affinis]|uniref:Uncharacterized protein n=1 Tax=Aldrovandia affinis TaxID=143900 RepID=A0AAD7T1T9_9TELE|nr:hypothetical protein AAFF_G00104440 [Aldrovandia affinis]